jgi:hypothetical protein
MMINEKNLEFLKQFSTNSIEYLRDLPVSNHDTYLVQNNSTGLMYPLILVSLGIIFLIGRNMGKSSVK